MKNKLILSLIFVSLLLTLSACDSLALPSQTAAVSDTPSGITDVSQQTTPAPVIEQEAATPEPVISKTIILSGTSEIEIEADCEELFLDDASYISSFIENASQFEELRKLNLGLTNASEEQLDTLRNSFPGLILTYSVDVCGIKCASNDYEIDISSADSPDVEKICEQLRKLPAISLVKLMKQDGSTSYTPDDAATISKTCPGSAIEYTFELFGQTISTTDERVEYVQVNIGDEGVEKIREILPFMTRLTYLKLDSCGISNEVMAQLRDDFPDIKVVWRVIFSGPGDGGVYNCLTDTEKIWATGYVTDGYTEPLKYCTDVKYLDLGHDCITHIDFVNYMPKLEVVILAITWVTDISPLANCPNLEYLEIFTSRVTDITPLANCTNLQYLNISNLESVRDISCLYSLTKLKTLYCSMSYIPQAQQDEIKSLLPDCKFEFGWVDPSKGSWRFDDNGEYTERYALLREQFGYDTFDYSR